ncbi:uncharacterized protein LOC124320928 isoform X2 [Daphnia pulicaria]|nr:uncharacterized protein LOC124320928 isoform X2 [Daphnia pulicaria]
MKALFPAVYDLIGSSCLVLAGLSVIAICIIYCVIPNIHSNSLSNKSKADSTPKTKLFLPAKNRITRYKARVMLESRAFYPTILTSFFFDVITLKTTTVLMEEKPQLLVINGATCLHM